MPRAKTASFKGRRIRDDLEDYVAERTTRNPDFPRLVEAAEERRLLLHELARARHAAGLTQTEVAALMKTSASTVARLERGEMNPTISTLQRFATAVGRRIDWRLAKES